MLGFALQSSLLSVTGNQTKSSYSYLNNYFKFTENLVDNLAHVFRRAWNMYTPNFNILQSGAKSNETCRI